MRKFLIKTFVRDPENVRAPAVRRDYGRLAGVVGLCANLLLCAAKTAVGLICGSIAIVADGVNNLSDAASSVVMLVGFRLAAAPGDKKHPYGHARIEYLTGLFISILIFLVGAKLMADSLGKILHPAPLDFNPFALIVPAAAVLVKIWLAFFNIAIGKAIDSGALKASGIDSRNDVAATCAVIAGILIDRFAGLPADGYTGFLVAAFILVSGVRLVLETADPLLGKAPDPKLVASLEQKILECPGVIGMHDLAIHDYGPGRTLASVHVEVDSRDDFLRSHDIIDTLEREVGEAFDLSLVIHMDPVDTKDPLTAELRTRMERLSETIPGVVGVHDLRIVKGRARANIIFDVVLSPECGLRPETLSALFAADIKSVDPSYSAVINFDMDYSGAADRGKDTP
ncbi:MAG: cation diffusion facilitator family transporter [Clostridiales Family XIII bacterium]|jgi:cation diffusion facilitator family transporter|nr:cation diffusion facilitator family transporter [Clostridiales Family XIII bacterium]